MSTANTLNAELKRLTREISELEQGLVGEDLTSEAREMVEELEAMREKLQSRIDAQSISQTDAAELETTLIEVQRLREQVWTEKLNREGMRQKRQAEAIFEDVVKRFEAQGMSRSSALTAAMQDRTGIKAYELSVEPFQPSAYKARALKKALEI